MAEMASDEQGTDPAAESTGLDQADAPSRVGGELLPAPPLPSSVGQRTPAWSYFLTPLAVVIGAVIVAGAIWWTDDDPVTAPAATPDPDAFTSATDPGPAASSPTTLLAAFTQYATELSLDSGQFQQCLGDQTKSASISQHLQRGQDLGVTGTPTFFINNKMADFARRTKIAAI